MIQQALNGMMALMLAKFALNDVPHALKLDNPVKTMGHFDLPPERPRKHLPKPVARVVIVPGGAEWQCVECGRILEPDAQAVKIGAKVYCVECARGESPRASNPANTVEYWDTGSLNSLENSLRMDPRGQKPGAIQRAKERILAGHEDPVVLDYEHGKYIIRDGRHRLEAYTQLGYKEMPVEVYGNPGPPEVRTYTTYHMRCPRTEPYVCEHEYSVRLYTGPYGWERCPQCGYGAPFGEFVLGGVMK